MGKIAFLYGLTVISLFVCLTVVLSLFGIGKAPPPPVPFTEEVQEALEDTTIGPEDFEQSDVYKRVPELYLGLNYTTPIAIPVYTEITDDSFTSETLPPGGVFYADKFNIDPKPGWYKITVSNGRRNMTRYIKADSFGEQMPAFYGKRPSKEMIRRKETHREVLKGFYISSTNRQLELARQQPEEVETGVSLTEIRESFMYSMNVLNSKGIVFPIMISLGVSFILAIFLLVLSGFKKAYSWEQDAKLDNYESNYGTEDLEASPDQFEQ
jgi:hypothetical protein